MDCFRLENAQGVFLPNEKAAGFSGGLLVHRWSFIVSRYGCQMQLHLLLNVRALWAAGTGSPAGIPYHVGVRAATENQRNGVVKKSVPVTVLSNIRPQRRRGAPQARPSRPDSLQIQNRVGIRDATKNQRNGVFKKSVPVTVLSNIRPQRRRGEPQARPSRPPFFIRSQEPAQQVPSCR